MMMRAPIILGAFLLAANQAALGADNNAAALHNHQFTVVKGTVVENYDGERLGTLKDFVLGAPSGKVEFALIKSGGVGPISKERIVPSFCLSLSSVKEHTLSLDVTDTRWGSAPVFKRKHLQDLASPTAKREIASFYHFVGDTAQVAGQRSGASLSPTGSGGERPENQNEKMVLASELVGPAIVDKNQKCLGKSCDVLIDCTADRGTFILFSAGSFRRNHRAFAVPLKSIQQWEKGKLILKLNESDLAAAAVFDWTRLERLPVYRYDAAGK